MQWLLRHPTVQMMVLTSKPQLNERFIKPIYVIYTIFHGLVYLEFPQYLDGRRCQCDYNPSAIHNGGCMFEASPFTLGKIHDLQGHSRAWG